MFVKQLIPKRISHHIYTKSKVQISRWSTLETTFNTRPNSNLKILKNEVGLFGVDQLTTADGFNVLTRKCMQTTDHLVSEALSPQRKRKMVEILDELSDSLCKVADLAEFIRFAHPLPTYSQAAENASIAISQLVEKLNTNVNLYKALKTAVVKQDRAGPTTEIDNLVGNLFLFDFEQSGIHLSKEKRDEIVELNNTILCLGQEFVHGVSNPKFLHRKSLPDSVRNIFPNDGDKVIISGLYADSANPIVREIAYKIFLHPDAQQDSILMQMLSNRHQLAQVCGFQTYAERALRGTILDQPQNVRNLLETLQDLINSKAANDFNEMHHVKKSINQPGPLAIWDVPYFTQKLKKERFDVCSKEYSPYFSLGACMEGLNLIFTALYGISLVHSETDPGEIWSKDVYKLGVMHEKQGLLGYIYCDFYERAAKPNQDCHFTIRGGKLLPDNTYQTPIVVLMLNFALPKWSTPTLLTPNMVDNLFHEMGHAMHSMLARTQYQHVSGTRCSTDFAEVPSILMEYFASDSRVLKLFAKHFQTKESMPDEMLKRLCASKKLFTASETQLQVFYSALDQVYHSQEPFESAASTTETLKQVQKRFYYLPYVENTAWQLRFSHLVGYGAKYYSYLVSRALAHMIWEKYFKKDPLSRGQGEKYRMDCLGYGGGKNPLKLVGDYLGVEPTGKLLAKSLNEEIEEDQAEVEQISRRINDK